MSESAMVEIPLARAQEMRDQITCLDRQIWALLNLFDARPDIRAMLGPREHATIAAARNAVGGVE